MSCYAGPEISSSGLIFAIDIKNLQKSWKGEPTTNILPSPSINGRFTTSNEWGTYNANQYNNNAYFSIGTISSVTSNIVTTSAAHPLRTFDVVTPQTTGGGVTAGTNYLVKKISSTQFSLHAYNSSQDGSQGYINSSTGYHKVHDSIALDQRVSINSTSFPTMWWGSPHLPNSALVKEVISNAGPENQNIMRLHINRSDNVADGMAYGVYVPVNIGNVINVSYWMRTSYPGKTLQYTTYFGGAAQYTRTDTLTSDWVRIKHQWTSSATFSFYQYWFPEGSSSPYWIDIADLQVEVNTQSGSTRFVEGTRSSTQAILDLTQLNTVTATSLTYSNNDDFSFNGSNNYLTISNNTVLNTLNNTLICWAKSNTTTWNENGFLMSKRNVYIIHPNASTKSVTYYYYLNNSWTAASVTPDDITAWNMYACSWDGTTIRGYLNGNLISSTNATGPLNTSDTDPLYIGWDDGIAGRYLNGNIAMCQQYNRALTSAEIQQNFNALRGRFGI